METTNKRDSLHSVDNEEGPWDDVSPWLRRHAVSFLVSQLFVDAIERC